ncbi:hypothetical protein CRUP_024169, partial [Coryphaenoides rupestris]
MDDPTGQPVLLLLLLGLLSAPPASARRSFGCLFQNELCSPYEICVNDGMFGSCYSVPLTEISTYDVSPAVVQRFRLLLEKLSSRGLTWEDDATQKVLAQELSKLRRIPSGPDSGPTAGRPVYPPGTGRRPGQAAAVDPTDRRVKPVEEELNRNLQTYLRRLALLPPAAPGPQAPDMSDGPSVPADHRGSRPLVAPGGQRSSSVQSSRPWGPQGEGELLVAALRHYLSGQLSPDTPGPPGPLYTNTGPEGSKSRLLKAAGAPQWSARGPLSSVDERFIQEVLRNGGRQHLEVEDLDQLSALIADALQSQKAELFSKLLAYLDRSTSDPAAGAPPPRREVGLENVRSRTQQAVAVQKKDAAQSVEEVSEVEGWIREVEPPAAAVVRAPPPHPAPRQQGGARVPELLLEVRTKPSSGEDVFGYVITDTDRLQTDEGLHLMEVLTHMANIEMSDVDELSVESPAVTFKLHSNRQNISTADVANIA